MNGWVGGVGVPESMDSRFSSPLPLGDKKDNTVLTCFFFWR